MSASGSVGEKVDQELSRKGEKVDKGALAGETKGRIFAQYNVLCVGVCHFFLLHCGAKPQSYGLVLVCFSLSCNPGAISLRRVAFHMESHKHAVSSSSLKHPGPPFC